MQIGQILQTLAVAPFEPPSPHLAYFYSQFDQVVIVLYSNLFKFILRIKKNVYYITNSNKNQRVNKRANKQAGNK